MLEPFYQRLEEACRKAGDEAGAETTRKQWLKALAEAKREAARQAHQPQKRKSNKSKRTK
jgi:hypothetical protein